MNITVFGGSTPTRTDYEQAEILGRLLGEAGHTVLTGGYIGTMEAVSKGAAEAGAHVIGVTCEQIENWRPVGRNKWVIEERKYRTLGERLFALIEECEAAIALPGGPGTLTEISLTWNLLLTEAIPARPLILVGHGWLEVFNMFYQCLDGYISKTQRRYLTFAARPEDAIKELSHSLG
jgi:uncharacterized protein (TIGR00730 family)